MSRRKEINQWSTIKQIIGNSYLASKKLFLLTILFFLISAFMTFMDALIPNIIVDTVMGINPGEAVRPFLLLSGVFAAYIVISNLINGFGNYVSNITWYVTYGYNARALNRKAGAVEPIEYEDSSRLDDIQNADNGANAASFIAGIYLSIIAFYVPALIALSVYYTRISVVLTICIYLTILPNMYAERRKEKLYSDFADISGNLERRINTYRDHMIGRHSFKETRHLHLFRKLYGLWQETMERLLRHKYECRKKTVILEFICQACTLILYMIIFFLIFYYLVTGKITVGEFTAVIASISTLIFLIDDMVNENLAIVAEHFGSVKNFIKFMRLKGREAEDKTGTVSNAADEPYIRAESVSFHYPNSDQDVISDLSFDIRKKELVAIVGENGSGKTTLAKLLMGIYLPTAGKILRDGADMRGLAAESVTDGESAVFQNYMKYQFTLRENITISDVTEKAEDGEISAIVRDIDSDFGVTLDTMLSKEFGGIDLSGGQWQKIAIMRGNFRSGSLILMDEPTAAIDPLKEYELYNEIKRMSENKTMLLVTHRLGAARMADKIIVMDKGKIAECGTHEVLMERNGKYRYMYDQQKMWYQ